MAKSKKKHVMEYAISEAPLKPHMEGRVAKDVLILGIKSQNRNRLYREDVRERALPKFVKKSVFIDHTQTEKGQKYYRRPYTELLGTILTCRNCEDGVRADIALSHHPECDRFIKDLEAGLPVAGFSPEMDVSFDPEAPAGEEWVSEIAKVDCVALTSCPATTTLVESVIDEDTEVEDLEVDGAYHKRRALMSEIEAILMAIKDEEENSDKQKFLKIHQILGEHLGIFQDCEESVMETKVEETVVAAPAPEEDKKEETKEEVQETKVEEGVAPEVKAPLPPDFDLNAKIDYTRASPKEIFDSIWK